MRDPARWHRHRKLMRSVGLPRNDSEGNWRKGTRVCGGIPSNRQFSSETKFVHEIALEVGVVTDHVVAAPTPTCAQMTAVNANQEFVFRFKRPYPLRLVDGMFGFRNLTKNA